MEINKPSSDAKGSKGVLREKSFQLAIRVVRLCRYLRDEKKEYTISKQLLRAGTNPGAMVREAANAETGLDFIHKLGVGQKKQVKPSIGWNSYMQPSTFLNKSFIL